MDAADRSDGFPPAFAGVNPSYGLDCPLARAMTHEFAAAANHSHAFVYFCENEARFVQALPAGVLSARQIFGGVLDLDCMGSQGSPNS